MKVISCFFFFFFCNIARSFQRYVTFLGSLAFLLDLDSILCRSELCLTFTLTPSLFHYFPFYFGHHSNFSGTYFPQFTKLKFPAGKKAIVSIERVILCESGSRSSVDVCSKSGACKGVQTCVGMNVLKTKTDPL